MKDPGGGVGSLKSTPAKAARVTNQLGTPGSYVCHWLGAHDLNPPTTTTTTTDWPWALYVGAVLQITRQPRITSLSRQILVLDHAISLSSDRPKTFIATPAPLA